MSQKLNTKNLCALCVDFRRKLEKECGWDNKKNCMKGRCYDVSLRLSRILQKQGFPARLASGYYSTGLPFPESWDKKMITAWKKFSRCSDFGENHCWIEAEDILIDVTSDQFHPGEEDKYRVIIIKRNKAKRHHTNALIDV